MYAVILAGGGGTRLHPLSRPERPKPFLPLLGQRSLLQGTVERLEGLTDDITVVTDRRYERLVREQVPAAAPKKPKAKAVKKPAKKPAAKEPVKAKKIAAKAGKKSAKKKR